MNVVVVDIWQQDEDGDWIVAACQEAPDGVLHPFKPPVQAHECTKQCKYPNMEYREEDE
jgi:hypothetical protein